MKKPAAFLDRDGTIVEDLDFLTDLADLRLLPNAASAIRRLNEAGWPVVVVTNQSGVARGFLSEKTLQAIHARLSEILAKEGAKIDAYYYCPHHPTIGAPEYRLACECRKPKSGMLLQAAKDLNLDLKASYSVGDSLRDGEAARAAGVTPILVKTGPGSDEAEKSQGVFSSIAEDLGQAVDKILPRS